MKYANHYSYSDVTPYEVIRVVSEKCLEVRRMSFKKDPSFELDIDPGGFFAHVKNQNDQKWIIESDAEGKVVKIRLHKNGVWKSPHGDKFSLSDTPVRFYDYNF